MATMVNVHAQGRACGTMEHLHEMLQQDPDMQGRMDLIEFQTRDYVDQFRQLNGQPQSTITIPVVFHVVYYNSTQNISDARIMDQLAQLNKDFAAANSDLLKVPAAFQPRVGNTGIQFCLAQRDRMAMQLLELSENRLPGLLSAPIMTLSIHPRVAVMPGQGISTLMYGYVT